MDHLEQRTIAKAQRNAIARFEGMGTSNIVGYEFISKQQATFSGKLYTFRIDRDYNATVTKVTKAQ